MDEIWPNSSRRDITSDCWVFLSSCPTQSVVLQTESKAWSASVGSFVAGIQTHCWHSLSDDVKQTWGSLFSVTELTTECLGLDDRKSSLSSLSVFLPFIPVLRSRAGPPAGFSGSRAPMPRSSGPGWGSWSSSPRWPETHESLGKVSFWMLPL